MALVKSNPLGVSLFVVVGMIALTSCTQLKYKDCSANRNCADCLNQYICKQCKPLNQCCPKYCASCTDPTTCTLCLRGFQLVENPRTKWKYCANSNNSTEIDYHRIKELNPHNQAIPPLSTKCSEGYFYQSNVKFCEKCLVGNCQLCRDAVNCMLCEEEYVLDKGICKKEVVVDDDDNVPVSRPEGDNNNNSNKEEKISTTLVYLIGLLTGCLLVLCLMQLYSCTITPIKNFFFRRFFKKKKNQNLIIDDIVHQPDVEMQQKGDKMSRFSRKSLDIEDLQIDSLRKAVITEAK